jgi:hypothetical protein
MFVGREMTAILRDARVKALFYEEDLEEKIGEIRASLEEPRSSSGWRTPGRSRRGKEPPRSATLPSPRPRSP